jgi:hypothetical protein
LKDLEMKMHRHGVCRGLLLSLLFGFSCAAAWASPEPADEPPRAASSSVRQDVHEVGAAVADTARQAGHAIKNGVKQVGHGVAEGTREVGHFFRDGAHAVGSGVKKGVQEVGSGVKKVIKPEQTPPAPIEKASSADNPPAGAH